MTYVHALIKISLKNLAVKVELKSQLNFIEKKSISILTGLGFNKFETYSLYDIAIFYEMYFLWFVLITTGCSAT